MRIIKTVFDSVHLIEPKIFKDNRGYFMETYQKEKFQILGLDLDFVQDNHSLSKLRGTLRGMHFQKVPKAQSKLIRVVSGAVRNVVVDIRKGSPTFLEYESFELSDDNKHFLFIPKGFANGMLTLESDTEILYKVDQFYSPDFDRSFRFDDPAIGIDWGIDDPILSDRDNSAPLFGTIDNNFVFGDNS